MKKKTHKETQANLNESQNIDQWFQDHANGLYRYSLLRVRDRDKAEDLVQETFLSAIQSKDNFAGRSNLRGWLLGILKNKISDYFRKESKERDGIQELGLSDDISEQFGILCWSRGFGPKYWSSDPHRTLQDKRFLEVVNRCLSGLPGHLRKVFVLRELKELDTPEIQETLGVKSGNIRVMLHRARVLLRSCVEKLWLKDTEEGDK
jgi:RNA polymerase sigma-70 factor, ECF subfamily